MDNDLNTVRHLFRTDGGMKTSADLTQEYDIQPHFLKHHRVLALLPQKWVAAIERTKTNYYNTRYNEMIDNYNSQIK